MASVARQQESMPGIGQCAFANVYRNITQNCYTVFLLKLIEKLSGNPKMKS